ncbi:hypothetical protein [Leucobacter sp. Z1108]|uniref:hypothetical protein n=1 Tax=Leucobacter sp. Z1108 TaxID=3439066 RepID=UPI00403D6689
MQLSQSRRTGGQESIKHLMILLDIAQPHALLDQSGLIIAHQDVQVIPINERVGETTTFFLSQQTSPVEFLREPQIVEQLRDPHLKEVGVPNVVSDKAWHHVQPPEFLS